MADLHAARELGRAVGVVRLATGLSPAHSRQLLMLADGDMNKVINLFHDDNSIFAEHGLPVRLRAVISIGSMFG